MIKVFIEIHFYLLHIPACLPLGHILIHVFIRLVQTCAYVLILFYVYASSISLIVEVLVDSAGFRSHVGLVPNQSWSKH